MTGSYGVGPAVGADVTSLHELPEWECGRELRRASRGTAFRWPGIIRRTEASGDS
jgi:hypothetical protein